MLREATQGVTKDVMTSHWQSCFLLTCRLLNRVTHVVNNGCWRYDVIRGRHKKSRRPECRCEKTTRRKEALKIHQGINCKDIFTLVQTKTTTKLKRSRVARVDVTTRKHSECCVIVFAANWVSLIRVFGPTIIIIAITNLPPNGCSSIERRWWRQNDVQSNTTL